MLGTTTGNLAMNQDRRDFFRNLGAKSAGIAASIAAPAALHAEALSQQIRESSKELYAKLSETAGELSERVSETTAEVNEQIRGVTSRIDTFALLLSYQQVQIHLIFLLLVISFAIDGGMTFFWVM